MNARFEDWLEQMRQARDPGPVARVIAVRPGRNEGWTYDVTDKTDLEDLAERIDGTIRDANCRKCELRAFDADGLAIGHLIYRADQVAMAQVVSQATGMGPTTGILDAYELNETLSSAGRTHRSFAVLALKGATENQEHAKAMITELRQQNTELVKALAEERRDHARDVTAIRTDNRLEMVALREENTALRERVSEIWHLEDRLKTGQLEKIEQLEKMKIYGRAASVLVPAAMAHFLPDKSPAKQNMRQQFAEQLVDSITPEQGEALLPLLREDQKAMLQSFQQLTPKDAEGEAERASPETAGPAAAAAKANAEASMANGKSPERQPS
jgi:hypothetical protein